MSTRSFIVVMGVLALVGLLGFGLLTKGGSEIAVGDEAPDGSLERLDGDGEARLADYRGNWTVVNFWASWCGPCRTEAPLLERFWQEHRESGTIVVGVDLDDNTDDALAFVDEFGLTYPQLRSGDGTEWRDDWGMTGFPESFLLDPEGRIAVIRRGPVTESVLNEQFEPVIAGGTGSAGS